MASVQITGYGGSRLNDTPSCSGSTAAGYSDRTTSVAALHLQQGVTYNDTVNVEYGYYTTVAIWIDYNNDSTFSSSELVSITNSGASSVVLQHTSSFTVPLTTATGTYRMRVRTVYNLGYSFSFTTPPPPCLTAALPYLYLDYGNCADYNVNIGSAPACSGTPTVSSSPAGSVGICNGGAITIKGSAGVYTGLSYQWYSGTSATGPWSAISGAKDSNYTTPPIISCRYFQLGVTCAVSGGTGYSPTITVCGSDPVPASLPYFQDFENWMNFCTVNDVPDQHWKNVNSMDDSSWRREDKGTTANWNNTTTGILGSLCCGVSKSGAHAADFHSYGTGGVGDIASPGHDKFFKGALDLYLDCSHSGGRVGLQFYWQNVPVVTLSPYAFYNSDSLLVFYSTDSGASFTRIFGSDTASQWSKVSLSILSASSKTIVRFMGKIVNCPPYPGVTNYSDIGLDSVYVMQQCTAGPSLVSTSPAGTLSACGTAAYRFNTSVPYVGGINYQWQMANGAGTLWSDIPGATNDTFFTPQLFDSVIYRVKVGCLYDTAAPKMSAPVKININDRPSYALLPMSESFEHWGTRCAANDIPSPYWVNQSAIGGYNYLSWRRSDAASICCTWYTSGSTLYNYPPYCYSPASQDSNYSARLQTYNTYPLGDSFPARADLYALVNCAYPTGNKELDFYLNMNSGSYGPPDTLVVSYSVDSGNTFIPLEAIRSTGGFWALKHYSLPTNSPKVVIKYHYNNPNKSYTYDQGVGLDNFKIVVPCTGKPSAGSVSFQNPCPGINFNISLAGATAAAGLRYTWYSSTDGISYTATGDTTSSIVANIRAATYFRARVYCSYTGLSDTASSFITLAPFYMCYCTPSVGHPYYPFINIGNINVTSVPTGDTIINNGNPYPNCPNPGIFQMYSDYRSSYGVKKKVYVDSTYRFALSTIISPSYPCSDWSCCWYNTTHCLLYIDYDHNANFDESELILNGTLRFTPGSYATDDTFHIPVSAQTGITGMRAIANIYYTSPYDPCSWAYFYGEFEDYLVDIEYATPFNTGLVNISGIEDMSLYPNPTSGKFSVKFSATNTVKSLDVNVMDMTGQKVMEQSYDNTNGQFVTELDMTGQPRGIYFVEFVADGQKMIRKLVVK